MMTLVKQIYCKPSHKYFKEFDKICFLSKNLYNATLYAVRKYFFETGSYLNYNSVNKMFTITNNVDYRALPAKVSKHTQMLVDKSFKSFFARSCESSAPSTATYIAPLPPAINPIARSGLIP